MHSFLQSIIEPTLRRAAVSKSSGDATVSASTAATSTRNSFMVVRSAVGWVGGLRVGRWWCGNVREYETGARVDKCGRERGTEKHSVAF